MPELIVRNQQERIAMEFVVMIVGVLGAGATLAFMLPGFDSFFSW